ncbi:EipA family protein, partial [Rhodoplanes roseus]
GNRTMMLVYNLPSYNSIYQRFAGVNGSAYMVGGLGMTVLSHTGVHDPIYVVPIRTGVGARLGVNLGYLKFTSRPTWNPF